ncbi:MAG: type II secretion system F family protein [Elusimicrobia bacterium]|nr:type II secretion system F family protein [Elusimicrobiota bacterium]
MPLFEYKAMDRTGRLFRGTQDAPSLDGLIETLKQQELFLVEGKQAKASRARAAEAKEAAEEFKVRNVAVDLKKVAMFSTELEIMIRSALPVVEALDSLARQQKDANFKAILSEISSSVKKGNSLSHSLARYPKTFDDIFLSLLLAGESSGRLTEMLERIVAYLNFQIELRNKIRGALLYPAIVVLTSVAVVAFLVLFILPTFMDVFNQLGVDLPLPTRLLLGLSEHLRTRWYIYALLPLILWKSFMLWKSRPGNARLWDIIRLNLPVVGPVIQAIALVRVLRTFSSLLSAGVPVLRAIELARNSAGNKIYAELLTMVYDTATRGGGLATALSDHPYFPSAVADMIANAEKTGTVPEVLSQVAEYYEKQADNTLRNLFSALEPIFVVFLGIMVGSIAIAILLPIFEIGNAIH